MNSKINLLIVMVLLMTYSCYSVPAGEKPGFYREIIGNNIVNFSIEAAAGKITIFVLSTDWCVPCKELKSKLLDAGFDPDYIELIYVFTDGKQPWPKFKTSKTYEAYMAVENLQEWPQVVIVNPAGNVTNRFDATILAELKTENTVFDETVKIVTNLYENMKTLEKRAGFQIPCSEDPFWENCHKQSSVKEGIPGEEKPKSNQSSENPYNRTTEQSSIKPNTPTNKNGNKESLPDTNNIQPTQRKYYDGHDKK